jgi:hypothetical protein
MTHTPIMPEEPGLCLPRLASTPQLPELQARLMLCWILGYAPELYEMAARATQFSRRP